MDIQNDLISIIIPVYNAEKYIEDAIKSVFNQTYHNWELILVDDHSSDHSVEIINKLLTEKMKLVRLPENRGTAYARNTGIMMAKGRFLAFLDADDIWKKEKLELQYSFMVKNKYSFTYTGYEFANESGTSKGTVVHVPHMLSYHEALKNTTISTITVMIDIHQVSKDLVLMPTNTTREDTATWWKILRTGIAAYGLDKSLSLYRRYKTSSSANKFSAVLGTWKLYRYIEKVDRKKTCYYFFCYIVNAIRRRI